MDIKVTLDETVYTAIRNEVAIEVRDEIAGEIADQLERIVGQLRDRYAVTEVAVAPEPAVVIADTPKPKKKLHHGSGLKGDAFKAAVMAKSPHMFAHIPASLSRDDYATRLGTSPRDPNHYIRYRCDVCGRVFLRGQGLNSHVRTQHVGKQGLDAFNLLLIVERNRKSHTFLARPDLIENEKTGT